MQTRRLGEERARAASLEASLARVLQDFQRERDVQEAAHAADRSAAQADIAALRRLSKARGRALHKVRSLAQDVLRGRSEIEVFLVTSLRMVRRLFRKVRVYALISMATGVLSCFLWGVPLLSPSLRPH